MVMRRATKKWCRSVQGLKADQAKGEVTGQGVVSVQWQR